jgi:branched-chain amino acid transport system permease protein
MRSGVVLHAVGLAGAIAVPLTGIYPVFVMKLLCLAMFACSFNLLLGFGGMLSFGHAAFFGAAAYASGWFLTERHVGPAVAVLGAMLISGALGLVIGLLAIRRRGIYLAMVTLALAQLVYFLCLEAPFTGGENGLQGVGRGALFGILPLESDTVLYYVVLGVFVAVYAFVRRIVHSPFGLVLKGIRENEQRAISLGYSIDRYRLLAFVLSASLAGLAGALKTIVLGFATLSDVSQATSGEVILMTLLGGIGTFFGPVLGAGIVVTLQEYLADLVGGWVTVIIGVIFVACVVAFRRGIVGEWVRWRREH